MPRYYQPKWQHGDLVKYKNTGSAATVVFYTRAKVLIQTHKKQYWISPDFIELDISIRSRKILIPSKEKCLDIIRFASSQSADLYNNYKILHKDANIIRDTIAGAIIRSECIKLTSFDQTTN